MCFGDLKSVSTVDLVHGSEGDEMRDLEVVGITVMIFVNPKRA